MKKENVIMIFHKTKVNKSQLQMQTIYYYFHYIIVLWMSYFHISYIFYYPNVIHTLNFNSFNKDIWIPTRYNYLPGKEPKFAVNSFSNRKNPKRKTV